MRHRTARAPRQTESAPPNLDKPLSRREFLRESGIWSLRASLLLALGSSYVRTVEPGWVQVERVRVTLPTLHSAFGGYRMVQLSDIHMGDWMDRAHLQEVIDITNGLQPDLVTLTGDFVTNQAGRHADDLFVPLGGLRARDGVLAVLGNHDQGRNAPVIRRVLGAAGIVELDNSVRTLERGSARLHIAGVGDVWSNLDRLDRVAGKLPRDGAAILLAHEPDFADTSAAAGRFVLQLSGHSHGGQVVIPFVGATRLPPLGRKYPSGPYRVGNMLLYTNRGLGMVRPHVRFNCRPEVTLFTLEPGPLAQERGTLWGLGEQAA